LKLVLCISGVSATDLSERHPEKQGLKLSPPFSFFFVRSLSERHPEKQGLKLELRLQVRDSFKSFRAPSRKTRIETPRQIHYMSMRVAFQSAIQKNKD